MSYLLCTICHRHIEKEAHGGPRPSPGDHDPAFHVAAAYGSAPWMGRLGPLAYPDPVITYHLDDGGSQ